MQTQILQRPINSTEFPLCRVSVSTQTKPLSVLFTLKKKRQTNTAVWKSVVVVSVLILK